MKKYSKITLFFVIVFILLFIYLGYYYLKKEFHLDASTTPPKYQKTEEEIDDSIYKQQYRLEYTLDNTVDEKMLQVIHLNKGDVHFNMEHMGDSEFVVVLKTPEEEYVAETGPYLLEVITEGKWRLSFK
jgi:hypothetical protein